MLQKLSIAFAQLKSGNTCENLLDKIRQLMYFLYQAKEISKKEYSNVMKSIRLQHKKWILYL